LERPVRRAAGRRAHEAPRLELEDAWFAGGDARTKTGAVLARAKQQQMMQRAKAVAGVESAEDWQEYLEAWRQHGSLTSRPTSSALGHAQRMVSKELEGLATAYSRVASFDMTDSFRAITRRYHLVGLWTAYQTAEEATATSTRDWPQGRGHDKRTYRKRVLFVHLHPEVGVPAQGNWATVYRGEDWTKFSRALTAAHRWHDFAETLGIGVLAMVPERIVPSKWVERDLKNEEFAIWLRAIAHFRPGARNAGRNWERVVERARSGRALSTIRRTLELTDRTALTTLADTASMFSSRQSTPQATGSPVPDPAVGGAYNVLDMMDYVQSAVGFEPMPLGGPPLPWDDMGRLSLELMTAGQGDGDPMYSRA
jgi:hypothetical protein